MKSIPNKFSFYHAGTTQRYDMYNWCDGPKWKCTKDGNDTSRGYYTEKEIRQHIADGDWWIISQEPSEPEMVFPFKYKHHTENQVGTVYKWEHGEVDGMLKVVIFDVEDGDYSECYDWMEEDAKRWIKNGTWIVTSVGEQPYELSEAEGPYNPSEAPTSPSKDVSTYTVKVNSDGVEEALKAAKELSDVVDSVNAGLERMNELLGQIGGAQKEYAVEITNRPDFNFEDS